MLSRACSRTVRMSRSVGRKPSPNARGTCSASSQAVNRVLIVRHLAGTLKGTMVAELNRPEVLNAINIPLMTEFRAALNEVKVNDDVTSLIIRSRHPGIFCAGADLKERISLTDQQYKRWSLTIRELFSELALLPVPVLVALDGTAVGGGVEMSLAADVRVAASNVELALPETGLGIIAGAGGTTRLPRTIKSSLAKELLFTSRRITSEEALQLGLVNHVVQQNHDGDAAYRKCEDLVQTFVKDRELIQRVKADLAYYI